MIDAPVKPRKAGPSTPPLSPLPPHKPGLARAKPKKPTVSDRETTPTLKPADEPPSSPRRGELLGYWTLAGQNGSQQENMHSVLARFNLSWKEWIKQLVQPQVALGLKKQMWHLPFGKLPGNRPMSFDSYIHAQQRRLIQGTGFVDAVRPLIDDGVSVLGYLGALAHGDMAELRDSPKAYMDDNWLWRYWRSIQPLRNAGCGIAFDAAASWPVTGPEWLQVASTQALGANCCVEGVEFVRRARDRDGNYFGDMPSFSGHLRRFPICANHQHFRANIQPMAENPTHPNVRHDDYRLYPSVTLMVDGHSAPTPPGLTGQARNTWNHEHYLEWAIPIVKQDLADGFNVALHISASYLKSPEIIALIADSI